MKLIILDRDGVINEDSDEFIKSPEEFIPVPGSLEAIARLNHAGYMVMVATNQSGLARGLFDIETLHHIHDKLNSLLSSFDGRIDGIFYCPHGPDDNCKCRKPKTGLFEQIAERSGIPHEGVPAIGDSLRDLIAARDAGCTPVLVKTGKGQRTLKDPELDPSIPVYNNLADFVDELLEND